MAQSLAVKYRPQTFDEVIHQESIVRILKRQIETKTFKNAYLFCGSSGSGKTTSARLLAKAINENVGHPIEIDAASNNGVENMRAIVNSATERAIDSKYKIYIIDEAHALSNSSWQALLKCIEEPPEFTIFIFCTTDPQKIPATILNRVQRYNFTRVPSDKIEARLQYICQQEKFTNYIDTCSYISKNCNGGLRDAISMLEKCAGFSSDLSIQTALESLGICSYDTFFNLINNMIDGDEKAVINLIDTVYQQGIDLKLFVDQLISFCLDISKYIIVKDIHVTKLPDSFEDIVNKSINFDNSNKYYIYVIDNLINLKTTLKQDTSIKDTVTIFLLKITRCE